VIQPHVVHPEEIAGCGSMFHLARFRACRQPNDISYTFLLDGETEEQNMTYGELDRQARLLAAKLQTICQPGDRALLLYGPGLEYVVAFFGCLYAGVLPVPAYPPDPMRAARTLERLRAIVDDCHPAVILGTGESLRLLGPLAGNFDELPTLASDKLEEWTHLRWAAPEVAPEQIAFLQYTSGSTSTPRGVMVSHRNIMHQLGCMFPGDSADVVAVSWLPMYHDMGLVGGMLAPFYFGHRIILMSPLAFVQRPMRWLHAISRYKATTTGGPNFAYDLCVSKLHPQDTVGLDLSSWRIAVSGAEPVRAETLERFTAAFAPFGFRPEAWHPCYGLAEGTLGVTGIESGKDLLALQFSAAGLEQNQAIAAEPKQKARRLVGCGWAVADTEVVIADPATCKELPPDHVGEIWFKGPSVAMGYWNRPEDTKKLFQAQLADDGRGPFMRTGDFGFMHAGQLFPTGRLKEMMIFWGRNIYPQDVERTVATCHPALRPNAGAAFAIERGGQELVVVQEIVRPAKLDLEAIAQSVRQAVQEEYQVPLHALALIRGGTLPKTASGKVQRQGTRQRYLDCGLDIIKQWEFGMAPEEAGGVPMESFTGELPPAPEIREWLLGRIARHCGIEPDKIDPREPLSRYILDSVTLMTLAVEMQQWLGRPIPPMVIFDTPALDQLAERLANPETFTADSAYATPIDQLNEQELDQALAKILAEMQPAVAASAAPPAPPANGPLPLNDTVPQAGQNLPA